jgi:hypothetical protein
MYLTCHCLCCQVLELHVHPLLRVLHVRPGGPHAAAREHQQRNMHITRPCVPLLTNVSAFRCCMCAQVGHTPQRVGINSAAGGKIWRIDTGMTKTIGGTPEVDSHSLLSCAALWRASWCESCPVLFALCCVQKCCAASCETTSAFHSGFMAWACHVRARTRRGSC